MKKLDKGKRRQKRSKQKIYGTTMRPRLTVFRSNRYVYVQLIDDDKQETIVGLSEKHIEVKAVKKVEIGKELGKLLAEKAKKKKVEAIVFDRRGYAYHGIVKAVAEGAREGGLQF
jgi:large subunit ribosomal protein L18